MCRKENINYSSEPKMISRETKSMDQCNEILN